MFTCLRKRSCPLPSSGLWGIKQWGGEGGHWSTQLLLPLREGEHHVNVKYCIRCYKLYLAKDERTHYMFLFCNTQTFLVIGTHLIFNVPVVCRQFCLKRFCWSDGFLIQQVLKLNLCEIFWLILEISSNHMEKHLIR